MAVPARLLTPLFWILLLLFAAFVLWLPLFPTGDGPLHIYFANVFWNVARHPQGAYAQVYAVRHLVQPYALHYYLLVGLEHFVSADTAEKLFVVLIFVNLATGFRALAKSLGTRYRAVALWVFPLLLNWTLGAGMLNYTFALGLLLWGLALYFGMRRSLSAHMPAFLAVLVLLVLAHPVPLMLLILMIAGDLVWTGLRRDRREMVRLSYPRLLAFGAACTAFIIPLLLADKAQMESAVAGGVFFHVLWLRYIFSGVRLGLMYLPNPAGWLYLGLLVAMLPITTALAVRNGWLRRLQQRSPGAADRLLLSTLLLLLLSCFFPEHLNGSALFADRMWLAVWLLGSACAAASLSCDRAEQALAGGALVATALSLVLAVLCLRPIALRQQQLADAPLPSNARGWFITAADQGGGLGSPQLSRSTYSLDYWAGARSFFAHKDVLMNSPWMNLTILPVRLRAGARMPGVYMPGALLEDPAKLGAALAEHSLGMERALRKADFILYSDSHSRPADALSEADHLLATNWRCTGGEYYALCKNTSSH